MKPPLPQRAEVVFPIVAGGKADRLPLLPRLDRPAEIERVDVVYLPPVDATSGPAAAKKAASQARIGSRHWHAPRWEFFEAAKQRASQSKPKSTADRAPNRVADARDCRFRGLNPLWRKRNLPPKCE